MDVQTDAGVDAALWGLEAAFVAHPPPRSLAGCPHCHGEVRVADADPLTLALALGNTLGTADDLRALTPFLLRRALTDERLDLRTVLGRIAETWADWTDLERDAVRDVVDAVWSALLDTHPDVPDGATAVAMLDGIGALGDPPDRLLAIWEYKEIASADHHLAELVVDAFYGARVDERVLAWARALPQRERLERARERDAGQRWAGTLAAACDLVG
ncbi:hypothetical protein [Actinomycetospora cinnamomea]|uniref:Uncharacterized protein n=1 Tax=Actinomycetospora cinnamomea TaxID=663609 RepID=A0A2U1FFT8_9PSEU|nr:hypothetical protein [Actinomycetospora cinnamomea]PVZ11075.1 hypothetical protein C8D89_104289 [Actinomycetospora cinnamomea]